VALGAQPLAPRAAVITKRASCSINLGISDTLGPVRNPSWHLLPCAGLATTAFLASGVWSQSTSLPLLKQADVVEAWFAGRADFSSEREINGKTPSRTARWGTLKPGTCSIKDAEVTIGRDGLVEFSAKVKSKDDHDTYCIILNFFDHTRAKVWTSPKICTTFELHDQFADWSVATASFRKRHYPIILFATREDYC